MRIKGMRHILLTLALLLFLSGCQADVSSPIQTAPNDETVTEEAAEKADNVYLSMATSGDWKNSFRGDVIQKHLQQLEERSGGNMKIILYDRNQMGSDSRMIAGVQLGTLNIVNSMPSMQVMAVPEAALLDIPGLFFSLDEFNELMSGDYQAVMQEYYNQAGLQLLSAFAFSYRQVSSTFPIESLADLHGLRIRTVENKYQEAFWRELGAVAMPYSFSELYFALHQGLVDAQENPVDIILAENLVELQNYIIFTNHLPMVSTFVMNKEQYDALSEENRNHLKQFMEELKNEIISNMPANDQMVIETLDNDYGMNLIFLPDDVIQEIYAAGEVVIRLLREDLGDGKVDQYLTAAGEAKERIKEDGNS